MTSDFHFHFESEARDLESSGQSLFFFFGSQLLLCHLGIVPSQNLLPAISGVLIFSVVFWGGGCFTLPWTSGSQAGGAG